MASGTWSYTSYGFNKGSGTWEFDESTGTLTVGGTKTVGGYSPPWSTYKESVKKVVILTGITGIDGGFSGYPMTDITFPEGLTSIGEGAFSQCNNLESLSFPSSLITIGGFTLCTGLKTLVIPDTVRYFNSNSNGTYVAFGGCTALTSVTIGANITEIPSQAFDGCSSLKEIYFRGEQPSFGYYSWTGGKRYYNFNLGTSSSPVTARVYTTGWGSDEVFTTDVRGSYTTFIYETWTPPSTGSTVHINVNGEWKTATPYVNVNGEWKEVVATYVNVNGEWKETV